MTLGLMLDAEFPPSPAQWVADLRAIGAAVGAYYVFNQAGGVLNYTAAHIAQAHAAGIYTLPIVVPGNRPPPGPLTAAVDPYGDVPGLIVYDVEGGSYPGPRWVADSISAADAAGWNGGTYCVGGDRRFYGAGWWWQADWIYSLTYQPVPQNLLPGASAWQYTHDVTINGSLYDVSVIDLSLLQGGLNVAQLDDIQNGVNYVRSWIDNNGDPLLRDIQHATEQGTGVGGNEIAQILAGVLALGGQDATLISAVQAVKTELDSLAAGGSTVDLTKVYTELANLGKHLGVDVTTGTDT